MLLKYGMDNGWSQAYAIDVGMTLSKLIITGYLKKKHEYQVNFIEKIEFINRSL